MDKYFKADIELVIGKHWDYVIHILSFLHSFLAAYVTDESDVHRLAAVTTELVENAVKYSADGHAVLRLNVNQEIVAIDIENNATRANIELLEDEFVKVRSGTPSEAYQRKILGGGNAAEKGLLGLARIRLESRDTLDFVVAANHINASVRFNLKQGAAYAYRQA